MNLGPDNEAIDHEEIHNFSNFDGFWNHVSIFSSHIVKSLTGGSRRADYALSHVIYVSISQIPVKYFAVKMREVVSERVKFLEA